MTPEPLVRFGRESTGELEVASRREWLVTNGLGGYASGTVAGVATRRYRGILVAAIEPPVDRTVLVAATCEWAIVGDRRFALSTHVRADGSVEPEGYQLIESFELDGMLPVWHYAIGSSLLERRVCLAHGRNVTYTPTSTSTSISSAPSRPLVSARRPSSRVRAPIRVDLAPRVEEDRAPAPRHKAAGSAGRAAPLQTDGAFDQLVLAADPFLVERRPAGRTVIAGYHGFNDWGRDTMIALPALRIGRAAASLRRGRRGGPSGVAAHRLARGIVTPSLTRECPVRGLWRRREKLGAVARAHPKARPLA